MVGSARIAPTLLALLTASAALAGCSGETGGSAGPRPGERPAASSTPRVAAAGPVPRPVAPVNGRPGGTVRLVHGAEEGEVVRVVVRPLPLAGCGTEALVLEAPDGATTRLPTLDPVTRLDRSGSWAWTFDPCPGDRTAYTLAATPTREHRLEPDGAPATLASHATYDDVATFAVPREGRVLLVGRAALLLDPRGERLPLPPRADNGEPAPLAFDGATQSGTWSVLGEGELRVVRPVRTAAGLSEPVDLPAATQDGGPVGEHEVAFTLTEETWLTAPLRGWPVPDGSAGGVAVAAPGRVALVDARGDAVGGRLGGGRDGLWHLPAGRYVARVRPPAPLPDAAPPGTLTLTPVTPTRVTAPGDHALATGPDGTPAVALFDLPGTHRVDVRGHDGGPAPWRLTWDRDEDQPCPWCRGAQRPAVPADTPLEPLLSGRGYLSLTSLDGAGHAVTVRIR